MRSRCDVSSDATASALVALRREEWAEAVVHAEGALELDAAHAKALWRRGVARRRLGELDGAHADLLRVAKEMPSNRECRRELQAVKELLKERRKKDSAAQKKFASQMRRKIDSEATGAASGAADWVQMRRVREVLSVPLIANGGVESLGEASWALGS